METQLENINLTFIQDLWNQFLEILPNLFLAIGFIIIAWVVIKIVSFILTRLLKLGRIDSLTTKLNEAELFGKNDYTIVPSKIIVKFIKYLLILIFIIIAAESLGLNLVSEGIGKFIAYLPILFSALLIFILGVYGASQVQKAVQNSLKSLELSGSNLIGNIVFYTIVVVVSITALNQAGIDTEIITSNLTIILGSALISFTIAFGFGAKEVVMRLLYGFYTRKNFTLGQKVKFKKIEGVIHQIDNICITISTEKDLVVIPIKKFVDQVVVVK